MRIVVVLPAPFGPRKACTSPVRTVRSRPSSAVALPNRLTSPCTSIALPIPDSLHRRAASRAPPLVLNHQFSFGRNPTDACFVIWGNCQVFPLCEILCSVIAPRGPLPARRMTAHWVVLAAAALTTLVAAAVGAALAVFAGQALPQAVRHDLVAAPGTALAANGSFGGGDQASTSAALRTAIGGALSGVPFTFWSGRLVRPLGLVPGALPARPTSAGRAPRRCSRPPRLTASPATRCSCPGAGRRRRPAPAGEIPAALPATSAALLHCPWGTCSTLGTATRAPG